MIVEIKRSADCGASPKDVGRLKNFRKNVEMKDDERIFLLYSAWSAELDKSKDVEGQSFHKELEGTTVPKAPHLEDCKAGVEMNNHLDKHGENGSSPPWTLWRGSLGTKLFQRSMETGWAHFGNTTKVEGAYPPWVSIFATNEFPKYIIRIRIIFSYLELTSSLIYSSLAHVILPYAACMISLCCLFITFT